MAFGDDQGRTEKPTPGRLNEARNRGDTHLSRELLTGATLLTAAIALRFFGGWLLQFIGHAQRQVDTQIDPIVAAIVVEVHHAVVAASRRRARFCLIEARTNQVRLL